MIQSFDLCLGVEAKPNIGVGGGRSCCFIIQSKNLLLKDAYHIFNQDQSLSNVIVILFRIENLKKTKKSFSFFFDSRSNASKWTTKINVQIIFLKGRSPGIVVKGGDSRS